MNLAGAVVRLRAVEPDDIDTMYAWENDPAVWLVSGTTAPFSRHMLERFVEGQKFDIFQTREQRLIIEALDSRRPVGTFDLFEFDPADSRAGIGILIHAPGDRGKGYASEALNIVCNYAREVLYLHQLWCNIGADNQASLSLFRKAGFIQTGVKHDWHRTPDGYSNEILMQKILE